MFKIYLEYFGLLSLAYLMHYSVAGSSDAECDLGLPFTSVAKSYNGNCYQFVDTEKKWPDAREYCWKYGGKLVTINDAETNNFITSTLNDLPWTCNGVYIGLHDRVSELSFEWVTTDKYVGQVMTYSNWARKHPNGFANKIRDCITMRRKSHWRWHEAFCDTWGFSYRFICQYEISNPPVPATPQNALQDQKEAPQIIDKIELVDRHSIINSIDVEILYPTKSPPMDEKKHHETTSLPSTMETKSKKDTQVLSKLRIINPEKNKGLQQIYSGEKKLDTKADASSKYKIAESLYPLEQEDKYFLEKIEVHNFHGAPQAKTLRMRQVRPVEPEQSSSSRNLYILFTGIMAAAFVVLIVILIVKRFRKTPKPVVVIVDDDSKGGKIETPKRVENEYVVNVYNNPMPTTDISSKILATGLDDYDNGYLKAVDYSPEIDEDYEFIEEQMENVDSDLIPENMYSVIPGDTEFDPIYASVDELQ